MSYLNRHGSIWGRFTSLLGAHEGSARTADDLLKLIDEYETHSPPPEAQKLHRIGSQALHLAREAAVLTIDNRDLKGAAAKLKQVQRLEGEAAREWDKLARQR